MTMLSAIALLAAASATGDVPVLNRTVERGETIAAGDFMISTLPPSSTRGALLPRDAVGQEAVRRLMSGSPVRSADIVTPRIVRRGEAVTIALVSGALRITAAGRALSDAAQGDTVRVVNLGTNRTIDAIADKPGQVRVVSQ